MIVWIILFTIITLVVGLPIVALLIEFLYEFRDGKLIYSFMANLYGLRDNLQCFRRLFHDKVRNLVN